MDKNFEAAKNISLEELNENTCKYMEGHPNEKNASFCGRKRLRNFLIVTTFNVVYQPKEKRDVALKDEDVPNFLEKKVKSA